MKKEDCSCKLCKAYKKFESKSTKLMTLALVISNGDHERRIDRLTKLVAALALSTAFAVITLAIRVML